MQAELLSTPSTAPKPKSRPGPKPKPDPEQDPTWTTFAALAVESGHVTQPPKAGAKTYRKNRNRGQVLAELVAEHGADEVLAVWRHTLTSPRETPVWWRSRLQGPGLIDAFFAGSAYQRLFNDLEAARKNGHHLQALPGGKATLGRLPKIEPGTYNHELELARKTLGGHPIAEEDNDAVCY